MQPAWDDEARHPHECILFGLSDQELMMAAPKIIGMVSAHMNVSLPELERRGHGRHVVLGVAAGPARPAGDAGSKPRGRLAGAADGVHFRSAESVGVSATFQRVRYFMTTLSTAYAVSNGAGGARASAGGSVRYGGPGANPKGVAPKVCCGGPGAERPVCPRSGRCLRFLQQAQGSAAA